MKFKVFVCVALSLIVILQAALVVMLAYGGLQVKNTVSDKTNSLSQSTSDINTNLGAIKNQLESLNNKSSALSY